MEQGCWVVEDMGWAWRSGMLLNTLPGAMTMVCRSASGMRGKVDRDAG